MRNKYRAWDLNLKKFRDEFDWVINAYNGKVYSVHDGEFLQGIKENLILQQCIGYKDCGGKEIYEGDIVEVSMSGNLISTCTVEFRGIGFWFLDSDDESWVFSPNVYKLEIIGHIYDTQDKEN